MDRLLSLFFFFEITFALHINIIIYDYFEYTACLVTVFSKFSSSPLTCRDNVDCVFLNVDPEHRSQDWQTISSSGSRGTHETERRTLYPNELRCERSLTGVV